MTIAVVFKLGECFHSTALIDNMKVLQLDTSVEVKGNPRSDVISFLVYTAVESHV